jgi:hypothetical protein
VYLYYVIDNEKAMKKYIEKIASLLENGKSIKRILSKIYNETGALQIQQEYIENILANVIEFQKIYQREKQLAERLGNIYKLENYHNGLIQRETEKLLACLQQLLKPIEIIGNTPEDKEKISNLVLQKIYESENPCEIPTRFEIKGVGVFDIDLISTREDRKVSMINVTLVLSLSNNDEEINLGNFYFDEDKKEFIDKVENKVLVEAIDALIELQSQNLKKICQSEIAEVVRNFFNENKIQFDENRAVTTSTIYFLTNNIKIRVSDHQKVTNPMKMFTTSDPFFMQRYQKAQERETPNYDFVAGKYPNGREYFENELKRIFG